MTWRRLFRLSSRTRADVRRDIDDEFAFHLAMRIEALERDGLNRDAARAQATAEFGDRRAARAHCAGDGDGLERRRRFARAFGEVRQDVAYGARLLRRSPGFSLAAIVTLTIGIGGNTAVFGLVNALLLKPVPADRPDRLLRIQPGERTVSWTSFTAFRERTDAFSDIAAFSTEVLALGDPGATRRVIGEAVSPGYFVLMGVGAALGRPLLPTDRGLERIVLSERTWRVYFDSDPSAVGRRITLDRRRYEVVGVMPKLFRGLAPPGWVRDFWVPAESMPGHRSRLEDPAAARFEIVGRLRDSIDPAQALASVQHVARQIRAEDARLPDSFGSVTLVPVTGLAPFRGVGALVPVFLFIAMLALLATLVLLIGCANLAGLLLGRAAARRQESAVRVALGAGRGRLVRQLLTESLLLALAGGACGIVLAIWLTGFVHAIAGQMPFPLEFDLTVDWRVFSYAMIVSSLTACIFGLAPARRAARTDVVSALKDDAVSGRRQRMRQVLTVTQVAACGVLLAWALLFARSLLNVTAVDPGFDAEGVLLAEITLQTAPGTPREVREAHFREVQEALRAMPFVESTGLAWAVPLTLSSRESFSVFLNGDAPGARGRPVMANRLTPGWFRTLRIPVLAGRDFTWHDRVGAPEVAVVNQTLATAFWNGDAIGKRLRFTGRRDEPHEVEVVGIVGDSKYWTLGEVIEPAVYLPLGQSNISDDLTMHIRTSNFEATAKALGQTVQRVAPAGFVEFRSMTDATAVANMPARVGAVVTGGFACVAVLLATLGIYGLVSYTVTHRTREIGVRKAIGATTGDILRLVLRSSVTLTSVGLAIGLGIAVVGAPALSGFVVGVSPADPLTLGAAASLVALAVLAASAVPALRAARVDPLAALREH